MTTTVPPSAQLPADPFDADEGDEVNQHGDAAKGGLEKVLGRLPGILSSKPVILFGIVLFVYLFLFAGIASLLGHPTAVSANTQLILGNYTNVSSSVGAGIAAGAGLTLIKRQRRMHRVGLAAHKAAFEARAFAEETHRLCHFAMPDHAAALGQTAGRLTPAAAGTPPAGPVPGAPAPVITMSPAPPPPGDQAAGGPGIMA